MEFETTVEQLNTYLTTDQSKDNQKFHNFLKRKSKPEITITEPKSKTFPKEIGKALIRFLYANKLNQTPPTAIDKLHILINEAYEGDKKADLKALLKKKGITIRDFKPYSDPDADVSSASESDGDGDCDAPVVCGNGSDSDDNNQDQFVPPPQYYSVNEDIIQKVLSKPKPSRKDSPRITAKRPARSKAIGSPKRMSKAKLTQQRKNYENELYKYFCPMGGHELIEKKKLRDALLFMIRHYNESKLDIDTAIKIRFKNEVQNPLDFLKYKNNKVHYNARSGAILEAFISAFCNKEILTEIEKQRVLKTKYVDLIIKLRDLKNGFEEKTKQIQNNCLYRCLFQIIQIENAHMLADAERKLKIPSSSNEAKDTPDQAQSLTPFCKASQASQPQSPLALSGVTVGISADPAEGEDE